jgi:hypothetical protein
VQQEDEHDDVDCEFEDAPSLSHRAEEAHRQGDQGEVAGDRQHREQSEVAHGLGVDFGHCQDPQGHCRDEQHVPTDQEACPLQHGWPLPLHRGAVDHHLSWIPELRVDHHRLASTGSTLRVDHSQLVS